MTTGQLIKLARKRVKKTQAALGSVLGVSASMVSQWENNSRKPKYETIRRIADALEIDWTELVPEDNQAQMVIGHIREKLSETPGLKEDEKAQVIIDYIKENIGGAPGLKEDGDYISFDPSDDFTILFGPEFGGYAGIMLYGSEAEPGMVLYGSEAEKVLYEYTLTGKLPLELQQAVDVIKRIRSGVVDSRPAPAINEFYNLPEDAQKKALKDINEFAEYVIEKYKKQAAEDKKTHHA